MAVVTQKAYMLRILTESSCEHIDISIIGSIKSLIGRSDDEIAKGLKECLDEAVNHGLASDLGIRRMSETLAVHRGLNPFGEGWVK